MTRVQSIFLDEEAKEGQQHQDLLSALAKSTLQQNAAIREGNANTIGALNDNFYYDHFYYHHNHHHHHHLIIIIIIITTIMITFIIIIIIITTITTITTIIIIIREIKGNHRDFSWPLYESKDIP
jgi:type IV secretory pathway component VirB8